MADTEVSQPADVSVVVPVLNGENVISRALDSVFAQTYSNFEIIVVDDGSTDQTVKIVSQRACKQLRLIEHSGNRGAAAARNTGIAAANGRWIAFLDCDDTWRGDKLARQIEALKKAGAGVMACATGYRLHKSGHALTFNLNLSPEKFRREISFGCTISPGSTLLVNRDVFGDIGAFDESFWRLEDWDWLLRFAKRFDMVFVPMPLADIYAGATPRSQDLEKIASALDRIRDKHVSHLSLLANVRLRGSLLVEKAAMLHRAGKPLQAAMYIMAALSIYPFRNMAFFRMLWRSVRTRPHPPAKRA